nr:MAG TPA: hypothetical protein [Caudoviricetes sp.]DAW33760.1 MAG TPA: hypothetical protein [Caudoviricetes sp.]
MKDQYIGVVNSKYRIIVDWFNISQLLFYYTTNK